MALTPEAEKLLKELGDPSMGASIEAVEKMNTFFITYLGRLEFELGFLRIISLVEYTRKHSEEHTREELLPTFDAVRKGFEEQMDCLYKKGACPEIFKILIDALRKQYTRLIEQMLADKRMLAKNKKEKP